MAIKISNLVIEKKEISYTTNNFNREVSPSIFFCVSFEYRGNKFENQRFHVRLTPSIHITDTPSNWYRDILSGPVYTESLRNHISELIKKMVSDIPQSEISSGVKQAISNSIEYNKNRLNEKIKEVQREFEKFEKSAMRFELTGDTSVVFEMK